MPSDALRRLIARWREDPGGTYRAWFLREERLENTTSILSGIVRLLDLAPGAGAATGALLLVAPDDREGDVRAQLSRPAFRRVSELDVRWLPCGELERHRRGHGAVRRGTRAPGGRRADARVTADFGATTSAGTPSWTPPASP